jgi:hypothetical protein
MVDPHTASHLKTGDHHEDERNRHHGKLDHRTPSPDPPPPHRNLICTLLTMVTLEASIPGMGIMVLVVYAISTVEALAPSGPLVAEAVRIKGLAPHEVTLLPIFGRFWKSGSTSAHAADALAAVDEFVEVYSAATRVALAVVINA